MIDHYVLTELARREEAERRRIAAGWELPWRPRRARERADRRAVRSLGLALVGLGQRLARSGAPAVPGGATAAPGWCGCAPAGAGGAGRGLSD